jgi:hypothetical protein
MAMTIEQDDHSTLLRRILAARRAEEAEPGRLSAEGASRPTSSYQLRTLANRIFGEINGWRTEPDYYFAPEFLGRGGRGDYQQPRWADHAIYYKARKSWGGRGLVNAAIVGQPYQMDGFVAGGLSELVAAGFKVSLPINPYASFWYPGATLFVIVTVRDAEVRLLPEQEVMLPDLVPPTAHVEHFRRNLPECLPTPDVANKSLSEADAT